MHDDKHLNGPSSCVFFERCYVYQSSNGIFSLVILTIFGFGAVLVSETRINDPTGPLGKFVSSIFLIGGNGLLGCSGYILFAILIDRRHTVRISSEGIWKDEHLVRWDEISSFYGTQYANGISLGFSPRHRRMHFEKCLSTTHLLTGIEYSDLTVQLREHLQRLDCRVEIELQPRIPTGD